MRKFKAAVILAGLLIGTLLTGYLYGGFWLARLQSWRVTIDFNSVGEALWEGCVVFPLLLVIFGVALWWQYQLLRRE